MFNNNGIESMLDQVLLWGFILLAIAIVYIGVTKKKIGVAATMAGIGLLAVVVAGMGFLVGTDFGRQIVSTVFNTN